MPHNHTRRCPKVATGNSRKNKPVVQKEVREKTWAEETYERFLQEGAILYKYMIDNFDSMFDGETVKHFCITEKRMLDYDDIIEDIMYKYSNDIQKELIHWIRREHVSGNLFLESTWKPFRELDCITTFFMGYRKMFKYKQYYFQLALLSYCDNCIHCKQEINRNHFELNLYGWVDEINDKLQPDNRVVIPEDNMMPDNYWRRKMVI